MFFVLSSILKQCWSNTWRFWVLIRNKFIMVLKLYNLKRRARNSILLMFHRMLGILHISLRITCTVLLKTRCLNLFWFPEVLYKKGSNPYSLEKKTKTSGRFVFICHDEKSLWFSCIYWERGMEGSSYSQPHSYSLRDIYYGICHGNHQVPMWFYVQHMTLGMHIFP